MSIPSDLTPAQQYMLDKLERHVHTHYVTSLMGRPGAGKTTILRTLHERIGGAYLTTQRFIEASRDRHPLGRDETVYAVLYASGGSGSGG